MSNQTERIITISPTTNQPVLERTGPTPDQLAGIPQTSTAAFKAFRKTHPLLSQRQAIVTRALELLLLKKDQLGKELTDLIGRPIAYTAKEIATAVSRGEYLVRISTDSLADTTGEPETGFRRYIRKEPLGPVLIIFAWNVRDRPFLVLRIPTFSLLMNVTLLWGPTHILVPLPYPCQCPHPCHSCRQ